MSVKMPKEFNIKLKKFDIKKVTKDNIIALLGRRRTGKSTLVKDILYNIRDIPVGMVICPTEAVNQFYGDIIPSVFIHDAYSPAIVQKFIDRQTIIRRKNLNQIKKFGRSTIDPYGFIILDDCVYDDSWTRDPCIRFLFMNGRHVKALFMFTMQHPMGVPPALRTNIDFTFILKDNNMTNRKKIYDNYAGIFPTFELFCEFMNQCTENFECLVIDTTADSNDLDKMVFWYKANVNLPQFRIGSDEYWSYNTPEEDDDDQDFQKNEQGIRRDMFNKKSNNIIRVEKEN